MKIALRVISVLLVVALGLWLWRYFHPSPQEAIRRRLADVARAASYEEPGGMLARAAKAQKLAGYFAPEISIIIDLPGQSRHEAASRDEIMRSALGLRTWFRSFKVQLLDPNITVGADEKSALVDLTLRAETPGDQYLVVQEIKCTLRQLDGEWIITRVETVKTLNRAPTPRSRADPALARKFHTPHESTMACSRRRQEADAGAAKPNPPPDVGGYEDYEICWLA